MKRFALVAALVALAGCGKLFENGSTGSTGTSVEPLVVDGTRRAPDVVFVVDSSGSMADGPDGTQDVCPFRSGQQSKNCKWDELLTLMTGDATPENGYVAQLSRALATQSGEEAQFGLVAFPGLDGGSGGDACAPGTLQVPIAPNSATDISRSLLGIVPEGATATAASLGVASTALANATDATARPKYVVLLTDGAPNCNKHFAEGYQRCLAGTDRCVIPTGQGCYQNDGRPVDFNAPNGCLDETNTVSTVSTLHQSGVDVFVVGFGADFASGSSAPTETLNQMAVAGGQPRRDNAGNVITPSFYSAQTSGDLVAAFQAVAGTIQSNCTFDLEQAAPGSLKSAKLESTGGKFDLALDRLELSADRKRATVHDFSTCTSATGHSVSFVFTPSN